MKNSKRLKLTVFFPLTKEEEEQINELINVMKEKRTGDYAVVAEMLKISIDMVQKSLVRITSDQHLVVVDALKKVIENRKKILR
jgi:hypothetical protein